MPDTRTTTPSRDNERGSIMVIAMLVMVALLGLGGLTVLNVQGGQASAGQDRFQRIAQYSAESGVHVAMEFLAANRDPATNWAAYVTPNNTGLTPIAGIAGNTIRPGITGNLFTPQLGAWYEVFILNNPSDAGFGTGGDNDARVIIRSIGHGPDGANVTIEVEVGDSGVAGPSGIPCSSYAQKGLNERGSGLNPCMGSVTSTDFATLNPGGP